MNIAETITAAKEISEQFPKLQIIVNHMECLTPDELKSLSEENKTDVEKPSPIFPYYWVVIRVSPMATAGFKSKEYSIKNSFELI